MSYASYNIGTPSNNNKNTKIKHLHLKQITNHHPGKTNNNNKKTITVGLKGIGLAVKVVHFPMSLQPEVKFTESAGWSVRLESH